MRNILNRHQLTATEKVKIVAEHFGYGWTIDELCERHGLLPSVVHSIIEVQRRVYLRQLDCLKKGETFEDDGEP